MVNLLNCFFDMLFGYFFFSRIKHQQSFFSSFWVSLLESDPDNVLSGFKSHWFLFEIIIKSMVLYLDKEGKLESNKRCQYYSSSFKENIVRLIPALMNRIPQGYEFFIPFPLFVTQLFDHLEAGILFRMVISQ